MAQLRNLSLRVQTGDRSELDRDLSASDLIRLGYEQETANRIINLLSQQEQLDWYLQKAKKAGCTPISRISDDYPVILRKKLGLDCPGTLWAKGNSDLLNKPAVSLVGSRELRNENRNFAQEAGRQAAKQGFVLISGNASGADQAAQNACLQAGGDVISIVADSLTEHQENEHILYLSEDGFDMPFTPVRALSRNRLIHTMGRFTMIAQCSCEKGGTWDGTKTNLRKKYSPVFCFQDHSEAVCALTDMGAVPVTAEALTDFSLLQPACISFLDSL